MRPALKKPVPATNYQVGYGKPPVHSRFPRGRSGNPRGRPKGARNRDTIPGLREEKLKTLILEEAYRPVTVNDPGGKLTIPMAQALARPGSALKPGWPGITADWNPQPRTD